MRRRFLKFIAISLFVIAGCSGNQAGTDTGQKHLDAAVDPGLQDGGMDIAADISSPRDQQGPAEGKATLLTVKVKQEAYVRLATMEVIYGEAKAGNNYDFHPAHCAPGHPCIFLHPKVGAINLGNTKGFHEVIQAPASGYKHDNPPDDLVIGDTFWTKRDAVNKVFTMSNNVYVLKLADGTYAKCQVISAEKGVNKILCYRQADGTRDLKTIK